MTLLICLFAAIVVTLLWYTNQNARELKVGILCYMFWGASLMWMVDALAEYIEDGADYFSPAIADMINDGFLGISVIVFALLIWTICLFVSDPRGVVRKQNE